MTGQIEQQFAQYQQWRGQLIAAIEAYQTWLDGNGQIDIQQSLRLYDLIESLRHDRITLAFIAEFSRGKTELINALFFSDFKQRLLPSDVGRTTMCPTEIFCDKAEEPYIRLLPIETRTRDESIATLKRMPVEWIKIRLNLQSREEILHAMASLTETKVISLDEAGRLGLWSEADSDTDTDTVVLLEGDRIEVPAWRHALINYPHPLLESGLTVLDTPGLNALGTEPELTLSMIPNAHAVLFLLGMDTGVTRSDLDIWQKYVQDYVERRMAVLNKADLLWDELKPDEEIRSSMERQVKNTVNLLKLPPGHVIAISAQKALIAKIRSDAALLEKSGIGQLERLLAREIIPAKRDILRRAVAREIGGMVQSSCAVLASRLAETQREIAELAALSGRNRGVMQALIGKLQADKAAYQETLHSFRAALAEVMQQGRSLLSALEAQQLDALFEQSRSAIEGSWTTAGLMRGMQALFAHFAEQAEKLLGHAQRIEDVVDTAYAHFRERHGFVQVSPPPFSLEKHIGGMRALRHKTELFCRDPVNVMTEKHFLVKKFYHSLVAQARLVFEQARTEAEAWLKGSLAPIALQLREHEMLLTRRVENAQKIGANLGTLEERARQLEKSRLALQQQSEQLEKIRTAIEGAPKMEAA